MSSGEGAAAARCRGAEEGARYLSGEIVRGRGAGGTPSPAAAEPTWMGSGWRRRRGGEEPPTPAAVEPRVGEGAVVCNRFLNNSI